MLNRKLEVKLVKEGEPQHELPSATPKVPLGVHIGIVSKDLFETFAPKILFGVVVYIAADTARQVIVKSTPTK